MSDRHTKYILLQNRKPKKTKQYYYQDDDDDDDDDASEIYNQMARRKARNRYISSDDIDSDYRRHEPSDPRIKVKRTNNGDRVILDEDDNVIKVLRNSRSPSPDSIDQRRSKVRPRQSRSVFYENQNGHVVSRPWKKNVIHTKKSEIIYPDDEPTKIIKKVIINPRTGARETIYERDQPRRKHKYFVQQRPQEILYDSDESDDQQQYVRVVKHRTIPTNVLPRHEPTTKYIMIKKRTDSEPIYARTSKMPAIRNSRRFVYETPAKKPITTYLYPTAGKYYK